MNCNLKIDLSLRVLIFVYWKTPDKPIFFPMKWRKSIVGLPPAAPMFTGLILCAGGFFLQFLCRFCVWLRHSIHRAYYYIHRTLGHCKHFHWQYFEYKGRIFVHFSNTYFRLGKGFFPQKYSGSNFSNRM